MSHKPYRINESSACRAKGPVWNDAPQSPIYLVSDYSQCETKQCPQPAVQAWGNLPAPQAMSGVCWRRGSLSSWSYTLSTLKARVYNLLDINSLNPLILGFEFKPQRRIWTGPPVTFLLRHNPVGQAAFLSHTLGRLHGSLRMAGCLCLGGHS